MLLHQVAELPEAQAEHVGGVRLDAVGALERALDVGALDVLQVPLQVEAVAGFDNGLARARRRSPAFADGFRQGRGLPSEVALRRPHPAHERADHGLGSVSLTALGLRRMGVLLVNQRMHGVAPVVELGRSRPRTRGGEETCKRSRAAWLPATRDVPYGASRRSSGIFVMSPAHLLGSDVGSGA